MFTGIVEGLGSVKALKGPRLTLAFSGSRFKLGDSVAINGVCLTVAKIGKTALDFDVSPETFKLTNLGVLKGGARVNIERPLTPQAPLGGHWVSGHVDAVVTLLEKEESPLPERERVRERIAGKKTSLSPTLPFSRGGSFIRLRFSLPKEQARFVALKGSIALDGISLTVTAIGKGWAETVLVPHTMEKTTLGVKGPGDPLNLEVDLLARYVQRLMETQ